VKKAHKLIPPSELTVVSKRFKGDIKKETEFRWEYFEKYHQSITLSIKPLFMALEFECDEASNSVVKAAKILKDLFKSNRPFSQCDTSMLPQLASPKKLTTCFQEKTSKSGYKDAFLVYDRLRKYLNNNKVYFNDSQAFKNFNEDIKITSNWAVREKTILRDLALPKLSMPIKERLNQLEKELEQAYIDVNERIKSNENDDITIKQDGTWTLRYPKLNKEKFEHSFFRNLKIVEISYVFDLVERRCKFMRAFSHHLSRYDKRKPYYKPLKATVIANGTWQGNYVMACRSNLDFDTLQRIEKDRLHIANIKTACDIISQEIAKLAHFQRRNRCEHGYHGSMDGSKHITKRETIKARYSKKYFGLMKGVVSLNLVIHEVPVNCDILGANEYEGHYLYDLYHGNSSGIDASILSTNTAGSNQVNFSVLDNIDVAYAPAYKSMFDRAQSLSGFKQKASYDGMLIKPSIIVPKKLILEYESEIKRIYASLYLNETSQQIIVQKICCRERQTQLKKAIWAYNNIFFSLHILKYVDNKDYKRAIRKSLNDGERYNRLFNAVVNVGGKKVRGLSETEINMWHHCTRLLTLIIIYYNTYIISRVEKQRLKNGPNVTEAASSRHLANQQLRSIRLI
jgi:TnpA family transposase